MFIESQQIPTSKPLNYASNHPQHVKSGVASCLVRRATEICSGIELENDRNVLQRVFSNNGYPRNCVHRTYNRLCNNQNSEKDEEDRKWAVTLPCVRGVSEKRRRVLSGHAFKTIFKPNPSLSNCQSQRNQF